MTQGSYRTHIPLNWTIPVLLVVLTFLLRNTVMYFEILCLCVAYAVLYFAYLPSWLLLRYNELGDYSYGIYIYAFPVQQCLAHFVRPITPATMAIAALLATLPLAVLSWHFVEHPALKIKLLLSGRRKSAFILS